MYELVDEPTSLQLPDPAFTARVTAGWEGDLIPCRRLWNGSALSDPVLGATPLGKIDWSALFAYMHRRFGPPHLGGDDSKDLSAGWLLDTPHPDVFVIVSPSLSAPGFSLVPQLRVDSHEDRRPLLPELSPEQVDDVRSAFSATLLDLLRPVRVRDHSINALGKMGGMGSLDEALLEFDDETGERRFETAFHPDSGRGTPIGLVGGEEWPILCKLVADMGNGNVAAGRSALITLLQKPAIEELSGAGWPIRRLVLLGSGGDLPILVRQAGLQDEQGIEMLDEIREVRRMTDRGRVILAEMTDGAVDRASSILGRLGFADDGLRKTVRGLRFDVNSKDAFDDLVRIAGDDFPEDALPDAEGLWEPDMPEKLQGALTHVGRGDIAAWVGTTLAMPNGRAILGQTVAYLQVTAHRKAAHVVGMAP